MVAQPPLKNLWVAAGDGDLERVKELIESGGMDPNAPDPFTYTPMHAAASYGHLHILEYLLSRGGNINITDSDGDTPIYTVENTTTAQFLVEHGAVVDRVNNEGISPVEHLNEDFPEVATYLQSHSSLPPPASLAAAQDAAGPSQHAQNQASETLTSTLLASVEELQARAAESGTEPDEEELRRIVSNAVLQGVNAGLILGNQESNDGSASTGSARPATDGTSTDESPDSKRPRTNGDA